MKFQSLEDAIPRGYAKARHAPALDDKLVGEQILFQWTGTGWQLGFVTAHYQRAKGAKKFNYELGFGADAGELHDTRLLVDSYGKDQPAGWFLLTKRR